MKNTSLELLLAFIVLVLISPWFYIAIVNKGYFFNFNKPFLTSSQVTDEINSIQGESNKVGVSMSRVVVNKYSMMLRQFSIRYLESYDPKFLFFIGGLDYKDSIRQSGVIYLGYLVLILYAVYNSFDDKVWGEKKRLIVYGTLVVSPLPSVFLSTHYDVLFKVGLLLILIYLAAEGFVLMYKRKKLLWLILSFFILLELINFYHNFYNHFPREFEKEVYGYWRTDVKK